MADRGCKACVWALEQGRKLYFCAGHPHISRTDAGPSRLFPGQPEVGEKR